VTGNKVEKMRAVDELRLLGFNVWLENGYIRYEQKPHVKLTSVDVMLSQGLIEYIRNNKLEAINFLSNGKED